MGFKNDVKQCPLRVWKEVWPHPWDSGCRTNIGFFVRVTPVLIVTLAVLVVVLSIDSLLKTDEASGYSAMEYAGNKDQAEKVIGSWSEGQQTLAAFSCGFHFLFLFLYASTATLLALWGANHSPYPMAIIGYVIAWLQLVGACLDMSGQSSIASQLVQGPAAGAAEFTLFCVISHLILLASGVIYFIICAISVCTCCREYRVRNYAKRRLAAEETAKGDAMESVSTDQI